MQKSDMINGVMPVRTIYDPLIVPPMFLVYVHVEADPAQGRPRAFTSRVGAVDSMDEARALTVQDRLVMGDTHGGLIEPSSLKGRTYRVFKALGWEEWDVTYRG